MTVIPRKVRPRLANLAAPWSWEWASIAAIVVCLYAAWVASSASVESPAFRPDVDQLWFAARAILDSQNPYDLIGPGREFNYDWSLYYPLPAVLLLVPFAPFDIDVARIAISSVPSALLAFAIARTDPRGLVIFISRAFYWNAWYAQWTPLLMLIWWSPALAFLAVCKPTLGIAMMAGPLRGFAKLKAAIVASIALLTISFLVEPGWVSQWLSATRSADHIRPWITVPFGWLLLLSALRWNSWQGRFLLVFSLIPQTTHLLAVLPLILLPRTFLQKLMIALLTFLTPAIVVREPFGSRYEVASSHAERFLVIGEVVFWTVLIPVLVCVLVNREEADQAKTASEAVPLGRKS